MKEEGAGIREWKKGGGVMLQLTMNATDWV